MQSEVEVYKTWLDMERRMLSWEMAADPVFANRYRPLDGGNDRHIRFKMIDGTFSFICLAGLYQGEPPTPYARAALVLSKVGCDWREDGR